MDYPEAPAAEKVMALRYAGRCRRCGLGLAAGTVAVYERTTRTVRCVECSPAVLDGAPTAAGCQQSADLSTRPDPGTAGASARREHERRATKREQRIRADHPRLGGLILALTDDPQSTRAWSSGAVGEQTVARSLAKWANDDVLVLHDRRIPRSKANIDHIAVAPTGVYVIDAKRYQGRPDHRVQGGILRPRTTTLLVGGRDRTRLLDGVRRQIEVVRGTLAATHPHVPVQGMLCFVDATWPLVGGSFSIDGIDVLWPRKAAQILNRGGLLPADDIAGIHRLLAAAFPRA